MRAWTLTGSAIFMKTTAFNESRLGSTPMLLAVYVSMWANTPPAGGLIAVGIEDDGKITGCTTQGQHAVEVERRIRNDLVPDAVFTTKRILATNAIGESNFVLLYRVQYREDRVVETNKGEAYFRRADSKHLLSEDEKRGSEWSEGNLVLNLSLALFHGRTDLTKRQFETGPSAFSA